MNESTGNPYRDLPSVDRVLADPRIAALAAERGHVPVAEIAREVIEAYRASITASAPLPSPSVVEAVLARASSLGPSLRPLVNATGVIIHTNLGRAPLAATALAAMQAVSSGYSNLEFDLDAGERGTRFSHLDKVLCHVTGADAAIAVNNNASALLLALAALCRDREVIISRGQLVEIGGGFRIPDVLRQSGATLVEVGTTNRTYVRDYAEAITERTAAILRVHSSNFRVIGFTEEPSLSGLASLARERGLLLLDDLGSGALLDTRAYGLAAEPLVQDSVRAGADVVLFSGDKLLGGPQAGIAVGRPEPIEAMRRHPLARAVRIDKASIAALAATLGHYAKGDAEQAVPVWRMIALAPATIEARARRWAEACGGSATVEACESTVGGGSLPGESLASFACAVAAPTGATAFASALRAADPPIIARIHEDRVWLDPRTVGPSSDAHIEAVLAHLTSDQDGPGRGR